MSTTTTSSYYSPIQSVFPTNPLTTTFTPPASLACSGIYSSSGIFVIDDNPSCLPANFTSTSTDYFSPGLVCPSGYVTACNNNAGVASITTVTCCPYRGDITLGCVPTPSDLFGVWETLFCTWIAPVSATTVVVTTTFSGGRQSVSTITMSSAAGVNALGVRMVYEASDLSSATATTTETGTSESTLTSISTSTSAESTSTGLADLDSGGNGGSGGLSTGATIAIAVVIPVVVIAAAAGLFFWMRKRKQQQLIGATSSAGGAIPSDHKGPLYGGNYDPNSPNAPTTELSGVGAQGAHVRNQQQELQELGEHSAPVELPVNYR